MLDVNIKYFSMFSGIGGFEYGIEKAYNNAQSTTEKPRQTEPQVQFRGKRTSEQGRSNELSGRHRELSGNRDYKCIGYSEIDKYATAIYRYHYPDHRNFGDATAIDTSELPNFDLLIAGFPCQSFSIAGKRKGFNDTRGTLFFEIARVLRDKRPRYFLLENVKGLLSHGEGKTFATILGVLADIGYRDIQWQVLNSKDFGVPQNRERVFITGHLGDRGGWQVFPLRENSQENTRKDKVREVHGIFKATERLSDAFRIRDTRGNSVALKGLGGGLGAKTGLYCVAQRGREDGQQLEVQKGNHTNTLTSVQKDNLIVAELMGEKLGITHSEKSSIRRLTPTECERLQGFPDGWTEYGLDENFDLMEISDTQRYKCLGNAVTTNVVTEIIRNFK